MRAIAAGLDERGIPTARCGKWSATQVMRLLEAGRPFEGAASPRYEQNPIRGTVKGEKGTGEFSTAVCGIFATISSFFAEATMRDEFSFSCR